MQALWMYFCLIFLPLLTSLQGIFLWDRQLSCLSYLLTPLIYFDHFLLDWLLHCTCCIYSNIVVRKCVVNTILRLLHGFTQYLHGRKLIFVPSWVDDLMTWRDLTEVKLRFSKNLTLANVKATGLFCKSFMMASLRNQNFMKVSA